MRIATSIALILASISCLAHAGEQPTTKAKVSAMVQRSLNYVQTQGDAWREKRDCVSCHRVSFTIWSLNRAQEQGYKLEESAANDIREWATKWPNLLKAERRTDAKKSSTLHDQNDAIGQLILGRSKNEKLNADWVDDYRESLFHSQQENGSWKAAGQLPTQKRSVRETNEVSTQWAMLALADYGEQNAKVHAAIQKANKWLGDETQPESTEWWATRLLTTRQFGENSTADEIKSKLLDLQHEDGGWSWLINEKSDALATGIVLYALARDGVPLEDPVVTKAVEFLARTQRENGSWAVNGTKTKSRNRVTETASYWGTCWAVIGVLEFSRE